MHSGSKRHSRSDTQGKIGKGRAVGETVDRKKEKRRC